MVGSLPFGRTDISETEARELIDIGTAKEILDSHGGPASARNLQRFVDRVPALLRWLENTGREYPWRFTRDPWRVYVSEILLQRTRGDAVADVYEPFFEQFPEPADIDAADDDEIYSVIHCLGFGNQRTRTLREAAELVVYEHGGEVPQSREELMRPYRVGPYSAGACMLFAHGVPVALADSNFARVLGRVFQLELPAQPHKCDWFQDLLTALVPDEAGAARAFNLAIIDLGALVCTPDVPKCHECPLEHGCLYAAERDPTGN